MILQVGTPFGVIGFSSMFDWGRETAVFQKPNMAETIVVGKWVTLVGPKKLRIDPKSWESVEGKRLGFLIFSHLLLMTWNIHHFAAKQTGVLFFSIFGLNIFIGVINDTYSKEMEQVYPSLI